MKGTRSISKALAIAGVFWAVASAQPAASQDQPAAAPSAVRSQGAETNVPQGMGMMMGKQGMMGGQGMMEMMGGNPMTDMPAMMPYSPCCPCGMNWHPQMMWPGMMMGPGSGPQNSAKMLETRARMMEMRAEMMKADAEIMEKYAKLMQTGK